MTSKQKLARENFKKVVKEAAALRKKNKNLTQTEAVKKAWAMFKSKKVGATKSNTITKVKRVLKKDKKILAHGYNVRKGNVRLSGRVGTSHKDNKSHNVNIRVVSGIPITMDRLTRINNDRNGNGRYVLHFLDILNSSEMQLPLNEKYKVALKKAKKIGGKKYDTKAYGGGIVFQSNSAEYLLQKLNDQKNYGDLVQLTRGKRKLGAIQRHNLWDDRNLAIDILDYADNNSVLYHQIQWPIIQMLEKKYKKGKFDVVLAAKAYDRYINAALKSYAKSFGGTWNKLISMNDRKNLSMQLAKDILWEFQNAPEGA